MMGGKKRKKKSASQSDTASDDSSLHDGQNTSILSSLISGANRVLYGTPLGSARPRDGPVTSTPVSPLSSGAHPDEVVARLNEQSAKLDIIMEKLSKLDCIEQIETKLNDLDAKVSQFDARIIQIENANKLCEDIAKRASESCDKVLEKSDEITECSTEIKRHEEAISNLFRNVDQLRREKAELESRVTDLQCRSMKMNLVFTGLGGEDRDENVEAKLRLFLAQELQVDHHIHFGNIHRFGRFVSGKCRPIVARFLFQRDLDIVKDRAFKLRGKPYGIHEQYPASIEEKRRELYPIMRYHRGRGDRVRLVRDRLYINGQLYVTEDSVDLHEQDGEGDDPVNLPQTDSAPTTGDVAPTAGDVAPTAGDVAPTAGDVAPTAGDGASPAGDAHGVTQMDTQPHSQNAT